MKTHKINDSVFLQFCPHNENFLPRLIHSKGITNIPLIIADSEIEIVINKLDLIDLLDFPIHYIEMIVAGCISLILKYPVKS
jgi:hypothetical protein